MKYRDLIAIVFGLGFLLSLPYGLVVNTTFWFLPIVFFVIVLLIYIYLFR